MMAALHQNLGATEGNGLFDLFVDLIEGDHVSIIVLFGAIKGAKLAIDVADVGIIDIAIHDVSDDVVPMPIVSGGFGQLTPAIGQRAELFKRQMIELESLGLSDALSIPNSLEQFTE